MTYTKTPEKKRVYCKDCGHCISNEAQMFDGDPIRQCGFILGYEDSPMEPRKVTMSCSLENAHNDCVHYKHWLNIFGMSEAEKVARDQKRLEYKQLISKKERWAR